MLRVSEHAIDRFLERAYICSRDEAKDKIYSLVIDRYNSLKINKAYYPISKNGLYAVMVDDVIVTVTKIHKNYDFKPIPKNKRKKWKGK